MNAAQLKAIEDFKAGIEPEVERLRPTAKRDVILNASPAHRLMSGAGSVRIAKGGIVTLNYTDGSTETATLTEREIAAGWANFFAFVSAVQEKRLAA